MQDFYHQPYLQIVFDRSGEYLGHGLPSVIWVQKSAL